MPSRGLQGRDGFVVACFIAAVILRASFGIEGVLFSGHASPSYVERTHDPSTTRADFAPLLLPHFYRRGEIITSV
jgi:hypothetical protein